MFSSDLFTWVFSVDKFDPGCFKWTNLTIGVFRGDRSKHESIPLDTNNLVRKQLDVKKVSMVIMTMMMTMLTKVTIIILMMTIIIDQELILRDKESIV